MADSVDGHLVILFLTLSILLGLLAQHLLHRYRVPIPYEVLVLCIGVLLGLVLLSPAAQSPAPPDLVASIRIFSNINPNLLLFCFLPILLFESTFSLNFHTLKTVLAPSLLLALPGVVVITLLTASLIYGLFPYEWSFLYCLLFGSLLSATDPVSTVAILKQVNAFPQISTIVEAEALLNDGVSWIMFSLCLNLALALSGSSESGIPGVVTSGGGISGMNVGAEIGDLVRQSVGGPFFGWCFAIVSAFLLSRLPKHMAIEVTGTVMAAYLCYLLSTTYLGASGILSLVVFGLFMGKWRNTGLSPAVHRALFTVWRWMVFVANTLLFTILGVLVSKALFLTSGMGFVDFCYCIVLYIVLQVTRITGVILLFPVSRLCSYNLSWREGVMLSAAGLRGPISLMLALLTALDTGLPSTVTSAMVFHTAGVVLLTNLINGSASKRLVQLLRLNEEALEDRVVLQEAMRRMLESAEEEVKRMKVRPEYSHLELDDSWTGCWQPSPSPVDSANLSSAQWESALTIRCLNVFKAECARMFERGVLSAHAFDQISAACDAAVDHGTLDPFINHIDSVLRVPWYVQKGWEARMTSLLHLPFDWMLQTHHLRSLEIMTCVTYCIPQCQSVIDAFTSLSCVGDVVREQVRLALSAYEGRMTKRMVDMAGSYPSAARQLQRLRAFISLASHQAKRACDLADHGLLTEAQMKALQEVVQERLYGQQQSPSNERPSVENVLSSIFTNGYDPLQRQLLFKRGRYALGQPGSTLLAAGADADEVIVIVRGLVSIDAAYSVPVQSERFTSLDVSSLASLGVRAVACAADEDEQGTMLSHAEGSGYIVGLYAALTCRPALHSVQALTPVEAFRLPASLAISAIDAAGKSESMWRAAALDILHASCPDALRKTAAPGLLDWAEQLAGSAQGLAAVDVPTTWMRGHGDCLLLLAGTLELTASTEEWLTLQAPAWISDSTELKDVDEEMLISIQPSQDAYVLLWSSQRRPTQDMVLAGTEGSTAEASALTPPLPPPTRSASLASHMEDKSEEKKQEAQSELAELAGDVEMTVRKIERLLSARKLSSGGKAYARVDVDDAASDDQEQSQS